MNRGGKMTKYSYEIDKEDSKKHLFVSKHSTECFLLVAAVLL